MKLHDNDAYRDEFMEAVYNLLSGDSFNDRANQVIDLFDAAPAVEAEPAPSNTPLTLEQLREMDGEPVWIRTKYDASKSFWAIVNTKGDQVESYARVELFEDYWSDWLAYRRKPEEGKNDQTVRHH